MKIPIGRIEEAIESNDGYCTACEDITNMGGVEPDAENYTCEVCDKNTVIGIENALLMGLLS